MSAIIKHSEERLMQVLLAPVISEKATFVAEKNEQVVFRVMQDATKPEIKAAVELLFKVEVESVQVPIARASKSVRAVSWVAAMIRRRAFVASSQVRKSTSREEAK